LFEFTDLLVRLAKGLPYLKIGITGALNRCIQSCFELIGTTFGVQPERVGCGAHQDLLADREVFPDLQLDINVV